MSFCQVGPGGRDDALLISFSCCKTQTSGGPRGYRLTLSNYLKLGISIINTHTHINIYLSIHPSIYLSRMYLCMYVCMHACMHACMYVDNNPQILICVCLYHVYVNKNISITLYNHIWPIGPATHWESTSKNVKRTLANQPSTQWGHMKTFSRYRSTNKSLPVAQKGLESWALPKCWSCLYWFRFRPNFAGWVLTWDTYRIHIRHQQNQIS